MLVYRNAVERFNIEKPLPYLSGPPVLSTLKDKADSLMFRASRRNRIVAIKSWKFLSNTQLESAEKLDKKWALMKVPENCFYALRKLKVGYNHPTRHYK